MEKLDKRTKFINKAKKIFGNRYDYSQIDYANSSTKINIICNKHNISFSQSPSEHLRGKLTCNLCTRNPKVDTDFFIKKSREIHGDKYNYSNVNYINSYTVVEIICPKHGSFNMLPNNHYNQNCPKCYNDARVLTNDIFIGKAKQIHGDKYNYELIDYQNTKDKIKIVCPEHGEFEQIPNDHISGKGCPKCGIIYNKLEEEIQYFLKELKINFINNTKKIIPPLELDVYIPSNNLALELNGLYWHCELYKDKEYHLTKTLECEKLGVQLIHIFEDEWVEKQPIVKSRIKNLLGLTPNKIFGRHTIIKEVSNHEAKIFLNNNHLQGNVNASIRLGLYHNKELVSLMTFSGLRKSMGSKSNDGSFELLRFCNKLDTNVIGGADKLLKNFIKINQPKQIISYADRRWSQGSLYDKLNFKKTHESKPSYSYIINGNREYRFKYRKDILVKAGYDKNKTEHQIMLERKIYRIYDCGTIAYKFTSQLLH